MADFKKHRIRDVPAAMSCSQGGSLRFIEIAFYLLGFLLAVRQIHRFEYQNVIQVKLSTFLSVAGD